MVSRPSRSFRAWSRLAPIALAGVLAGAVHVGSSNAYFEGMAGPYPLRVIVRTPGVIPGLAQITVRVTGQPEPDQITVRPLRSDAGLEGAPPPDTASRSTRSPSNDWPWGPAWRSGCSRAGCSCSSVP